MKWLDVASIIKRQEMFSPRLSQIPVPTQPQPLHLIHSHQISHGSNTSANPDNNRDVDLVMPSQRWRCLASDLR